MADLPIMAESMLMLFKFTTAFLAGIGPILILFLMFDQTNVLFKKPLFCVLGKLFSMSMLSVVTAMVLKFTARVAVVFWVIKLFSLGNRESLGSQCLALRLD